MSNTKTALKIQLFFTDLLLKTTLCLKVTQIICHHSRDETYPSHSKIFLALNKFSFNSFEVRQTFKDPFKGCLEEITVDGHFLLWLSYK